MTFKIIFSPLKSIAIDLDITISVHDLMKKLYALDEDKTNSFEEYSKLTLLVFEDQWIEDSNRLCDYANTDGGIIRLISLHDIDKTNPMQYVTEEFFCQMSCLIFYKPIRIPTGYTFEDESLKKWLSTPQSKAQLDAQEQEQKKISCPYTRNKFLLSEIKDDIEIKDKFTRLIQRYPMLEDIIPSMQYIPTNPLTEKTKLIEPRSAMTPSEIALFLVTPHSGIYGATLIVYSIIIGMHFALRAFARGFGTTSELESYGINEAMINQFWTPVHNNHRWSSVQNDAVIYLMTGNNLLMHSHGIPSLPSSFCLSPEEALKEISGLQTMTLFTLMRLRHRGLTGDQLRNWRNEQNNSYFTQIHLDVLIELIEKRNILPEEALNLIQGLSAENAMNLITEINDNNSLSI